MASCRKCGHEHRHEADRMACDAVHGYVRRWPKQADPPAMCELCGDVSPWSELLEHFRLIHGGERLSTGHLVRMIRETNDVGDYRDEVRYPAWTERDPSTGDVP